MFTVRVTYTAANNLRDKILMTAELKITHLSQIVDLSQGHIVSVKINDGAGKLIRMFVGADVSYVVFANEAE